MRGPGGRGELGDPSTGGKRGLGRRGGDDTEERLSGRDGSGGALDRYEPISLQIGQPDLVSVLDSLEGSGARRARVRMRTECLAFGVPICYRAGNRRLALAVAIAGQ